VADSSWHHYVNINLKGFPHPAPLQSNSDKIGQFYGNLAIWLAPIHKRRQMAQAMYRELADYTLLLDPHNNPIRTGEIAYSLLGRSTSPCEMHELLRAFGQPPLGHVHSSDCPGDHVKKEQEALGLVLDSYQQAMILAERETVSQGLTKVKAAAAGSTNIINGASKVKGKGSLATSPEDLKEWTIELKRDSEPDEPPFATLVFRLDVQDGVVTGQVWEGIDRQFISTVTGTHEPLPDDEHWYMALVFTWGNVNMVLSGTTVKTPETIFFDGRYTASAASATLVATNSQIGMLSISSMAPADGDTGTGTGQQT